MEAAAQNPNTARVLGIPVGRMILYTFGINAVLVTRRRAARVADHERPLGRRDQPRPVRVHRRHHRWLQPGPGGALRGLLVGLLQNWSGYYLSSAYRDAIPLLLMILVILWRPQGLFGIAEERTV